MYQHNMCWDSLLKSLEGEWTDRWSSFGNILWFVLGCSKSLLPSDFSTPTFQPWPLLAPDIPNILQCFRFLRCCSKSWPLLRRYFPHPKSRLPPTCHGTWNSIISSFALMHSDWIKIQVFNGRQSKKMSPSFCWENTSIPRAFTDLNPFFWTIQPPNRLREQSRILKIAQSKR